MTFSGTIKFLPLWNCPLSTCRIPETIGIGFGELIKESLVALGIHMGKLQKKGFPCQWFNCTVKPKRFEQPVILPNGFDTTGCNQSPNNGMKSKAALISSKVANLSLSLPKLVVMLAQQPEVALKVCLKTARCILSCL